MTYKMTYKVFVSYSWSNSAERRALETEISRLRNVTMLVDRDIKVADNIYPTINSMIDAADCVVVFLTEEGLKSDEVRKERDYANRCGKLIIPVVHSAIKLEELPEYIRKVKYIPYDLTNFDDVISSILARIDELVSPLLLSGKLEPEAASYLGIESKSSWKVVAYCKDGRKFSEWNLKVPGMQLAENLGRRLSPKGDGTEDATQNIQNTNEKDSVNWQKLWGYETLFIVDSKAYNPYLESVLNNYSKYLKGKVDFKTYDTVPTDEGETAWLQDIVIKGKDLSFRSTKHEDPSKKMKRIDEFEDYLLIMRLPREIAPRATALQSERPGRKGVIWVIAGIHGKATQAGVSFLTSNYYNPKHYSTLFSYLSNRGKHFPPEFFEAVFRIPKESRHRNKSPGLVLHLNDLGLDTLGNDRTAPESNLVYFQELHTRTEPGLRDSPPFGLAEYFCSKKCAQIPIHSVHLDVVADCNFDCQDCIEKSGVRRLQAMLSLASICEMLIELREVGCRRVRFDGGEPTLHPDFPVIVRLAAALGLEMDLVTNGSLLSDRKIQQAIVSAGKLLRLRVSMSGYSPGVSQKLRMLLHPDLKDTTDLKDATEKAVCSLIKEGVTVAVSMLLYNGCIEEVKKACEFWRSKGAESLCLLPVLNKGGAGQKRGRRYKLTANDEDELKVIMENSGGWVTVPDWYHDQLYRSKCPSTTKECDRCYSAYYRIAISPAKVKDGPKRQANGGLQLHETDRAWISLCPHHRHDKGYGCNYPCDEGGLREWMEGGRLEIAESIKDNIGKCQETICSSDTYNRQTHQEIKGIEETT